MQIKKKNGTKFLKSIYYIHLPLGILFHEFFLAKSNFYTSILLTTRGLLRNWRTHTKAVMGIWIGMSPHWIDGWPRGMMRPHLNVSSGSNTGRIRNSTSIKFGGRS